MKILMLTPYLPYPPASGGQIRTLYLLKYLAQNHSITLVSLYKDNKDKQYADKLKSFCDEIYLCKRPKKPWQINNIFKSVFSNLPFLIVRNYSEEAVKIVKTLLEKEHFDIIHAETFYIMPHIPETKVPILLVEQTIEYKVYQHFVKTLPLLIRIPLGIDILKLIRWEKHYWNKANLVATVSQFDKQEIQSILPKINPEIIPNGAGDEMFIDTLPLFPTKKLKILFMGNFFWLQNVEAAQYLIDKVYPSLTVAIPSCELIIAGQNVKDKIKIENNQKIKVVNLDPGDIESVKNLYQSSNIFIAPIFGPGGTRLKILASMASGLPVVSTSIGVEGLELRNNEHFLIAENPEEFVSQILKIAQNKELFMKIQHNAHSHVKKYFSWEAIALKLEKVYEQVIKNN